METLQVAEWWRVSPSDVELWGVIAFADRQEYMYVQMENGIDPSDGDIDHNRTPYLGPTKSK